MHGTPFGDIYIVSDGSAIISVKMSPPPGGVLISNSIVMQRDEIIERAVAQFDEYFSGERRMFDIPIQPGGTPFQQNVWEKLLSIPYGETRSYKQVAQMACSPKAYRAVGMANNKNPIMIIIPCHRVVGADGSLTGYAGGLDMKKGLLDLECRYV